MSKPAMDMFDILNHMQDSLRQLDDILTQEQQELSAGRVNAAFLHRLTENKNEQLSTLSHFDKLRIQMEQTLSINAPYDQDAKLNEAWLAIQSQTRHLSQNNHQNGLLLEQHLKHTQEALNFLEKKNQPTNLYGPDGQSHRQGNKLGRKFGV
ncbi:flagellar biosynthesis protein FlgN [Brenneria roseae subsp. roseae]|uniref:flagella synthesis protein FlgN n=1 Tax=Brenneria roseae TaxID=1509241 RepID=UPI000D605285|nr:flagellar export chaperone FlgN [Brenneria roseae]PWC22133.1 flagellar biosynthesis protein FlgN [Brenneria roseae subsp. roseae]